MDRSILNWFSRDIIGFRDIIGGGLFSVEVERRRKKERKLSKIVI